jgi:hypothetical protein
MGTTPRLPKPSATISGPLADSLLAHQPALLESFLALYATLWGRGIVDHPTKEIVRIRSARITDCGY